MTKTITIAIFLLLMVGLGFSQPLNRIKGTVIDQSTKEPISYAGISIEGTFTGAASDLSGNFEFEVPPANTGTFLIVSAVGYQTIRIAISGIFKEHFKVEMIPTLYEIGNVDVIAGSVVLYGILKKVVEHIGNNYLQGAYSQKMYFKGEAADKGLKKIDEAILDYSDSKGYHRESVLDAYNHRNYNFLGVKRNFEVKNLADGMNPLDDLLNLDIVRVKGNVLDVSYLTNYDLKLDREGQFEGDSVWVINYRLRKPDLSKTGDFYVTSYQGKLTVSKSNYSVLKNETLVKASDYNSLGRAFANAANNRKWLPVTITYDFNSIYRKGKTGYNLAYLKYNRHNTWKDKITNEIKSESFVNYLIPLELNVANPVQVKGRIYFSEMAYDKKFWEGFDLKVE